MEDKNELQQQIWEFMYGLLPESEAKSLCERISSDPEFARLYAEEKLRQEIVAAAARCEQPTIKLSVPKRAETQVAARNENPNRPRRIHGSRVLSWILTAAAGILLCLAGHTLFRADSPIREELARRTAAETADAYCRIVATAPLQWRRGAPQQVALQTTSLAGDPRPARLSLQIRNETDQTVFAEQLTTDPQGQGRCVVPANVIKPDAQLLVQATDQKGPGVQSYLDVQPDTYVAKVGTDKPVYLPGETVYYRSLTLSRFSLEASGEMEVAYEALAPSGLPIDRSRATSRTETGVGNGAFVLPGDAAGGDYTLLARSPTGEFAEVSQRFVVLTDGAPRLSKEIEFVQDRYQAGDTVVADLAVRRPVGGPASKASLTIEAYVDDQLVWQDKNARLQADGTHQIKFRLPETIQEGNGLLAVKINDDGLPGSLTRRIPIWQDTAQVSFYPEGGGLVAGVPGRVYFQARSAAGDPVDIQGELVDAEGTLVESVETVHDGRGVLRLTPAEGQRYWLRFHHAQQEPQSVLLPQPAKDGTVVMDAEPGVFDADQPIVIRLRSVQEDLPLLVAAVCRGATVGQQTVTTAKNDSGADPLSVEIPLVPEADGVIQVTVYDGRQSPPEPVAERLVYRRPQRKLKVRLADQASTYSPGSTVDLSLLVTNERGEPTPATLAVGVYNQAIHRLFPDAAPALREYFQLTNEISSPGMEDAEFALGKQPGSEQALDLLLGTRGWRKFVDAAAEQRVAGLGEEDARREDGKEALAMADSAAAPPLLLDNGEQAHSQLLRELNSIDQLRQAKLSGIGQVLFLGGAVILIALTLQGLLQLTCGWRLWIPTFAAATTCLLLGGIWFGARVDSSSVVQLKQSPFAQHGYARQIAALSGHSFSRALAHRKHSLRYEQPQLAFKASNLRIENEVWGWQEFLQEKTLGIEDSRGLVSFTSSFGRAGFGLSPHLYALRDQPVDYKRRIRVYAHKNIKAEGRDAESALSRFTQLLYWHPELITDKDGRVQVQFDLDDHSARYQVHVEAHGQGRLGSLTESLESRVPFYAESKAPRIVSVGDRIDIPLTVVNTTDRPIEVTAFFDVSPHLQLLDAKPQTMSIEPGVRWGTYLPVQALGQPGQARIGISLGEHSATQTLVKTIEVAASGYPARHCFAGLLRGEKPISLAVPADVIANSASYSVQAFPSPLADLRQGAESLSNEPSRRSVGDLRTRYPDLLALNYMKQRQIANPRVTRKAKESLKEVQKQLQPIQAADRRQAPDIDSALATLELITAMRPPEVDAKMDARQSDEPYVSARTALSLLKQANQTTQARQLLEKLKEYQQTDGHLSSSSPGAFGGGGLAAADEFSNVETTALAALAWLRLPEYQEEATRAIRWLMQNRDSSGGFGSSRATMLALKAIVEHSKEHSDLTPQGDLVVRLNGEDVARERIHAGQKEAALLGGRLATLEPGQTELALELTSDGEMPFLAELRYLTSQPKPDEMCPLRISTRLSDSSVEAGGLVSLFVEVENISGKSLPMSVAAIGLPAGLSARVEQLDEMAQAGAIDHYELRPREIVIYWQSLSAEVRGARKASVNLDLVAEFPGRFTGPASHACLVNSAEHKHWSAPLEIEIRR